MIKISSPLDFPAQLLREQLLELSELAQNQGCTMVKIDREKQIEVWQLDQVCSLASGNKYFKQALYWLAAEVYPDLPLLSFGGPYSNHLYALAAEAQRRQRKLIAIVRGLHEGPLNSCLQDIRDMGASIQFVSRLEYRRKEEGDYLDKLRDQWGSFLHVPEGGGGLLGAFGAQAIGLAAANKNIETLVLALGTGSTAAGVLAGLDLACRRQLKKGETPAAKRLLLVPVLKLDCKPGQKNVLDEVNALRAQLAQINAALWDLEDAIEVDEWVQWECCDTYHFGGYGKFPSQLAEFLSAFERQYPVRLDPVYTAKAMAMSCRALNKEKYADLPEGTLAQPVSDGRLLFIHSGGLQGRRGFGLL